MGSSPTATANYMLFNTMYFTMLRKRKNRRGPKHTGLTTLAVSQKVTRVEYDAAAWSELQYIVLPMLTSISNRQVEGDVSQ